MATETRIQHFVHKLEEGGWAKWLRFAVLLAAIAFVAYLWLFRESGFKGLSHEKSIEQAQIARELARGKGFSTKMIRPAALWQFQSNKGAFPLERTPDAYHAPLNPAINAVAFRIAEGFNELWRWLGARIGFFQTFVFEKEMNRYLIVYTYDKIVAAVQLVFYLLAVLVSYFTAKRLFDRRLALLGMGLLLVCQAFWDFSMSGLPQMLMLFLFSCAGYALVRALEERSAGRSPLWWLVSTSALFGLLALTHGLTMFMFVGALVFVTFYFRPVGQHAAIMLAVFSVFYGPWLVRNHVVSGNPVGLGWYSGLYQVRGTESQIMRTMALEGPLKDVTPTVFGEKFRGQIVYMFGDLYQFFGYAMVAPIFFVALLHLFKRPETAMFRWCILSMWLFAVFGMAIFGVENLVSTTNASGVRANDLYVLFIPLMTFYGLAFVLVLWSRLELNIRLVRIGFFSLIYLVSALPFLTQLLELLSAPKNRVPWPPYVSPYVAILAEWTTGEEIIASDMPWAVAWYADRKSLWLPMSLDDFISLNDYNQLGGRMVGLHLTPVTGNQPFIHDIMKGEFKAWAPFITRQANIKDFPLRAFTPLPIDGESFFYSDRDRWTPRED